MRSMNTAIRLSVLFLERTIAWGPPSEYSYSLPKVIRPERMFVEEGENHQKSVFPVNSTTLSTTTQSDCGAVQLLFKGGGIFFYWQAGVVCYLREKGYDLSKCRMSGASAGALTATLTATGVDFYEATDLALNLALQAKVWGRGWGLQGIWGTMIEEWLHELLPNEEAVLMGCVDAGRLRLLVTPIPSLGKRAISKFESKHDLVRCNMASVHLPWFLDGQLTTDFRGEPMIDGSFLSQLSDYCSPEDPTLGVLCLDWNRDPVIASKAGCLSFVQALSPKGIWDLLEQGKRFAQVMDEMGEFEVLPSRASR